MKRTFIAGMLTAGLLLGVSGTSFGAEHQTKNPYEGKAKMVKEGQKLYDYNCKSCHGEGAKGDVCPDLTVKKKKYGNSDTELFKTIAQGQPGGMPNWDKTLGTEKIWKIVTYLRSLEK
ncbi:MAG: c-type cytochrome [Nitrospirae bacterium]|nr:MAG: c-type cytochrome [Nitrospirota bacterium]